MCCVEGRGEGEEIPVRLTNMGACGTGKGGVRAVVVQRGGGGEWPSGWGLGAWVGAHR